MKKILFIATGGTVASTQGKNGLNPRINSEELLTKIPEIKNHCYVKSEMLMNIDSTNMTPERIKDLAKVIFSNYQDYDGFVIAHGTDTMGYTLPMLTYMLKNLNKPIVATGSQVPIVYSNTDAKENLFNAFMFTLEMMPGVYLVFSNKIIKGTRAVKVKTKSLNAFESINSPCVGLIENGKIKYCKGQKKKKQTDKENKISLIPDLCSSVFLLKLHPGLNLKIFEYIKRNYKAIIVEAYGLGGIPNIKDFNISKKLKELIEDDIVVVVTTQCLKEGIDLEIYEVGREIAQHQKIIRVGDMNTETAMAKLMWALAKYNNYYNIKEFMETPIFSDHSC